MGTSWRCRRGDSGWEHRGGVGEVTVDGNIVKVVMTTGDVGEVTVDGNIVEVLER